jgi:hypothetical protein
MDSHIILEAIDFISGSFRSDFLKMLISSEVYPSRAAASVRMITADWAAI